MGTKKNDILLLYEGNESEDWKDYVVKLLSETNKLHLRINAVDITVLEGSLVEIARQYFVVTILLSPTLLSTMEIMAADLSSALDSHACVSVILLFTSQEEYSQLIPKYRTAESWRVVGLVDEDSLDPKKLVLNMGDMLEEARLNVSPRPQPNPVGQSLPIPQESKVKEIYPDCVRKKENKENITLNFEADDIKMQTTIQGLQNKKKESIVIVFRKEVEGKVEVSLGSTDEKDRIETKRLNPFNFKFKAPVHKAGRPLLRVFENGREVHKQALPYLLPSQVAFQSAGFLAQCFDMEKEDTEALDAKLAAIFEDSCPDDALLDSMFKPEVVSNLAGEASKSDVKFPTLLHFAAYHGFSSLTAAILESPGSSLAYRKLNKDGHDPCQLAEEGNHIELAEYIAAFMETQAVVDIYMTMHVGYYNKKSELTPGYITMSNKGESPEDMYDQARVWGERDQKEPPYVTGTVSGPLVPEVTSSDEEGDKPPRPPRPGQFKPPAVPSSLKTKPDSFRTKQGSPYRSSPEPATDPRVPSMTPEEFMGMAPPRYPAPAAPAAAAPLALGSRNMEELEDIQTRFKTGEFTLTEVEMLYESWKERNREGKTSASIKERRAQLEKMREKNQKLISKKGTFSRFTKLFSNKKSQPEEELAITHLGNQYCRWSDQGGESRDRASTSSTSSSSSAGSAYGGFRDSGITSIVESDSDSETAPPLVARRSNRSRTSVESRKSLGELLEEQVETPPPRPPPPRRKP